MIVQQLQPWITLFSEEVLQKGKHGDTVKVGGRIVSIFDTSEVLQDSNDVYVTLDDGIGINEIVLPVEAYRHYQKKEAFTLNDIIVTEGRILKVDTSKEGKQLHHPEAAVRIASWSVSKLDTLSEEGGD